MDVVVSHDAAVLTRRWMAVGRSSSRDSAAAGHEAAMGALQHDDPRLGVLFCSAKYDLPVLLGTIAETLGDVPLVGCSTAGEIAADGAADASVVLAVLGGPGFHVATASALVADQGLRQAGAHVAGCLAPREGHPHQVLLLLTDGLAGDQQEIVRGAYSVVGASVPLVGGCAGDDLRMTGTHQFHDRRVLTGAVVGAAISSDAPLGIGVHHGWRTIGEPLLVTRSESNLVYSLDGRPALDVYLERLDAPPAAHTDAEAFTRFALTHPLGLSSRGEEVQARFIGGADFTQRGLSCIAAIPQGSLVWFMEGDAASVLDATDAACQAALGSLDGNQPIGALAFDCIARRGVLGDAGISQEVDRIAGHTRAPVAGFYTYGEIARTRGMRGFHNQTLVMLAVS